ncbi:Uncharacterised protein [Serratia liquefaciens]|nr:Uncharacterised protein [Serratia liquefaciens]
MSDKNCMNPYQQAYLRNDLQSEQQKILDHIEVTKAQLYSVEETLSWVGMAQIDSPRALC